MDTLHLVAMHFWSGLGYFLPIAGFLLVCGVVGTVAVGIGVGLLRLIFRAVLYLYDAFMDRRDGWD